MNILRASLYFWVIVLIALLVFGVYVFYVTSAPIDGKVLDYNGKPVPGATVVISSYEEKYTAVTHEDGSFHLDNNFLQHIENGNYHVVIKVKHGEDEYIGYEGDLKIEGKPIKKTFYFKNKEAVETLKEVINIIKAKFDELRPTEHPSEGEEDKMKYESKPEPQKDTVDLLALGDYSIVFRQNEEGNVVYIDLMCGDKLVERGQVILNCSLFSGYIRPPGYHTELMNSIGLDEVKNKLTSADGTIKIWTKHTWPKEGQPFTDIIISPLSVYNERIGKSKSFFDLNNGLAYAMEQAGFTPSEGEEQVSTPPPSEEEEKPEYSEAVKVDLTNLGDMKLHIKRTTIGGGDAAVVCLYLLKDDEIIETGICPKPTNFWVSKGETREEIYRPKNMYPKLKNTIGIIDVGKLIDADTIELSKDDGIIFIIEKAKCGEECTDVTIISESVFNEYFTLGYEEVSGDKVLVHYTDKFKK